ncbi:hypothetical protein [Brevundimonas sp.]|uniref:hypothetical protein n=1 Tax=Brevundimonas sp. TaxID=1871086 RepID=UPI0035695DBA
MSDLRNTDPAGRDPRERDFGRGGDVPAVSPWVVVGAILLLGLAVYVVSAFSG